MIRHPGRELPFVPKPLEMLTTPCGPELPFVPKPLELLTTPCGPGREDPVRPQSPRPGRGEVISNRAVPQNCQLPVTDYKPN